MKIGSYQPTHQANHNSSFLSFIVSLPFQISWGKETGQPVCKYSLAVCHAEAGPIWLQDLLISRMELETLKLLILEIVQHTVRLNYRLYSHIHTYWILELHNIINLYFSVKETDVVSRLCFTPETVFFLWYETCSRNPVRQEGWIWWSAAWEPSDWATDHRSTLKQWRGKMLDVKLLFEQHMNTRENKQIEKQNKKCFCPSTSSNATFNVPHCLYLLFWETEPNICSACLDRRLNFVLQ